MVKIIEARGDYNLSVAISKETETLCYQLLNTETGVVEVETTILPQAYKYLEDLSAGLEDAIDSFRASDTTITNDTATITRIK